MLLNYAPSATLLLAAVLCHAIVAEAKPLPRSTPEAEGVDSAGVLALVEAFESKINAVHSLMLVRHGKVVAEPGSIYLLPRGCRVIWRVLSDEPFRHLCITYPNPSYPIPVAASARGAVPAK